MRTIALLLATALWCGGIDASIPNTINYQGHLTSAGGTPVNAAVSMVLRLYAGQSGGVALYSETQTVTVTNGVFNVQIGSVTPLSLGFDAPYFLGVAVGADPEMAPRQPLAASPYALRAMAAETVNGVSGLRLEPSAVSPNHVAGHPDNYVTGGLVGVSIGGGGAEPTICDLANHPCRHRVLSSYATIGGGLGNLASGSYSTIGGGSMNSTSGGNATIAGGYSNQAGSLAAVGGGQFNEASGFASTVSGGSWNTAAGGYSLAAGYGAKARRGGMFVWADASSSMPFDMTQWREKLEQNDNTFNVRATGGVYFATGLNWATGQPIWACYTMNGNGWSCTSDRNAKRNLRPVDTREALSKVAELPVYRWQPRSGANSETEHVGPMAQDFHAAFGLGDSDKSIGLLDATGVALAAIQGLNAKLDERTAAMQKLLDERDVMIASQAAALRIQASRIEALERSNMDTLHHSPPSP